MRHCLPWPHVTASLLCYTGYDLISNRVSRALSNQPRYCHSLFPELKSFRYDNKIYKEWKIPWEIFIHITQLSPQDFYAWSDLPTEVWRIQTSPLYHHLDRNHFPCIHQNQRQHQKDCDSLPIQHRLLIGLPLPVLWNNSKSLTMAGDQISHLYQLSI